MDAIIEFATSIPLDWIIIGALTLLFAFDVMRNGAGRVCAIALAFPIAMLLTSMLPKSFFVGGFAEELSAPPLGAIVFLILFAAFYLLIRRIDFAYTGETGRPLQSVLTGFAGVAILVVIWLEVPALATLWQFGGDVQAVFNEAYRFWWLVGSYATLAFARN